MNKNEKEEMISNVKEMISNSSAVYLTDYAGISVADISNIRNEFRKQGVKYRVIKNTLFQRALSEVGKFENLSDHLVGMTGFAFANGDNSVAPAKIIKKYFDSSQKLSLKACYIENQYYDGSRLEELANLPTKSEIISSILSSINAPASGIVGAINAVMRDLVNVVDQIAQREAA